MSTRDLTEAQYLMRKIVALEAADVAAIHPWLRESDRWNELVLALLTRISSMAEPELRALVDAMSGAGLLDIPALAAIPRGPAGPDAQDTHARRVLEFMVEAGIGAEDAQRGLAAICDAAQGMSKHYGGKVQRYLRNYGELMLRDLERVFEFTTLSDADVKQAFIYWLQNVLNMPVSLLDDDVRRFCKEHSLAPEEWVAAADELDINLALVDDLVQRYLARQSGAEE